MKKPIIDMNFINDGQLDILYHDNFWLFVFKNHRRTYIGCRSCYDCLKYSRFRNPFVPYIVKEAQCLFINGKRHFFSLSRF